MISSAVSVTNAYSQSLDADAIKALATFGEGVVVATSGDATIRDPIRRIGISKAHFTPLDVHDVDSRGEIRDLDGRPGPVSEMKEFHLATLVVIS